MKDYFSEQSADYARFRPSYPDELYAFLYKQLICFRRAWDCGTGNGQVASVLAERFRHVEATDISARQMEHAPIRPNIHYSVQAAETALFPKNHFDLITVAQAVHWFDFETFFRVVRHCLHPGGCIALVGYEMIHISPEIDAVIDHFYHDIIGPYWYPERKHIENGYQDIPFPFEEVPAPGMEIRNEWRFGDLTGYLGTWSAVQRYRQEKRADPVAEILEGLKMAWGAKESRQLTFPLIIRVGRKEKAE